MFHSDFLLLYILVVCNLLLPVLYIFFIKKIIDKVGLILWLYFFLGFMIEFIPNVLLVSFNINYTNTFNMYWSIFPGSLFMLSLIEIVYKKGLKKSLFITVFLTVLLIIINVKKYFNGDFFSEVVYRFFILFICIYYLIKYLNLKNYTQSESTRIKNLFVFSTLIHTSAYIYMEIFWHSLRLNYPSSFYVNLINGIISLITLFFYLNQTYILIQVAKRNNAGKITFGANAVE